MTRATVVSVLEAGLEIIQDPERWVQKMFAITKQNDSVEPHDKQAYRFCARGVIGHIRKVSSRHLAMEGNAKALHIRAQIALYDAIPEDSLYKGNAWCSRTNQVAIYNNSISHPEVVAWFKRAIALEQEKERVRHE